MSNISVRAQIAKLRVRMGFEWLARRLARKSFPKYIHIENTNICPYKCVMCPREKLEMPQGMMSFETFQRLVDEIVPMKVRELHLHGFGEPLVEKNFYKKVAYASSRGLRTYFITTGGPLTESIAHELISAGLWKVKFSFYGVDTESYEQVHVGASFDKARANILRFLKIRHDLGLRRPKVILQFVPQIGNRFAIEEFRKLWASEIDAEIGDILEVTTLHNYGDGREYNAISQSDALAPCWRIFQVMHIMWNGTVVSCSHDTNAQIKLGDINLNSIEQIWFGAAYKGLRRAHLLGNLSDYPLCKSCDLIRPDVVGINNLRCRRQVLS